MYVLKSRWWKVWRIDRCVVLPVNYLCVHTFILYLLYSIRNLSGYTSDTAYNRGGRGGRQAGGYQNRGGQGDYRSPRTPPANGSANDSTGLFFINIKRRQVSMGGLFFLNL